MNFIDLLFVALFIGMLVAGFFQGMIRFAVVLLALYLAVVLASFYYGPFGAFLSRSFGTPIFVGQYIAFAIVVMIGFIVLTIAGLYTFRYAKPPGGFVYLDHVGGTILGMFLGVFLIGVFGALLWNLMIVRGGANIGLPFFDILGRSVAGSALLRYFVNVLLPLMYSLLDPVLPAGADLIFVIQ
ncbi:MAG: CvpA family protein [Oscillochloridaceae bacterium umkhey_bin13]